MLSARLHCHKQRFDQAGRSLDNAVAADFGTRDTVLFHLIKARLLLVKAEFNKAKDILEAALDMEGVRIPSLTEPVELEDRSSVFIELTEAYKQLKSPEEALAIIKQAQKLFKGTTEEVRVLIARSKLSATTGGVMNAIAMLKRVPISSPSFIKARMVMADLYLNKRKDRDMYIKCYQRVVEMQEPSKNSLVALGDAYMKIQEPDKAIAQYEKALNLDEQDVGLATMIGEALVSTHDYLAAINYYLVAVNSSPGNRKLHIALAGLYIKLKQWGKARRTIEKVKIDVLERSASPPACLPP